MSQRRSLAGAAPAPAFAALGDPTRLQLIGRLCLGEPLSTSELSRGSRLTRQAITKHLRVLEGASLVASSRQGRRTLFTFAPAPIWGLRDYLDLAARQWDERLGRLKALVESDPGGRR
jgi:DNA-binding transcriptional ArsR family regulator